MLGWAVVVALPAQDEIAERSINSDGGYRAYLPRFKKIIRGVRIENGKRIRTRREGDLVPRPLFPGYLFVELDPRVQPWHAITTMLGVSDILKNTDVDRTPRLVRPEVIDAIRHFEAIGYWDEGQPRRDLREMLDKGELPQIKIPGLYETLGTLVDLDPRGRAKVLLSIGAHLFVDARSLELVQAE